MTDDSEGSFLLGIFFLFLGHIEFPSFPGFTSLTPIFNGGLAFTRSGHTIVINRSGWLVSESLGYGLTDSTDALRSGMEAETLFLIQLESILENILKLACRKSFGLYPHIGHLSR